MRTRLAIACGLAALTAPAFAQTTTCAPVGNFINCTTSQPSVYTPPPPIQQVDVAGAIRLASQMRAPRPVEPPAYFGENPATEFIRFRESNPWYDLGGLAGATQSEKQARALADITADKYAAQGLQRKIPPSEFFALVGEEVRRQIPGL